MPKFQYIDTTGATQSVDAVDAATAIKGAKNIAPNSGVSIQSAPSPVNMPAAPAMPAGTAPVPAAPKSKAFTGVLQPDGTFKYPGQDTGSAGAQPPKSDAANPTPPATTAAPAPSPTTLTMPEGQTLEQVAAANGTNVQAIMAANPQYANPTAVKTGSQLTLPGQKTLPSGNTPYGEVSKSIYGAVSAVPNQNDLGAVTSAGAAALTSAPPTTDLITASIQPIVDQMNALIAATVAPGPTYKSLSDEYQNLASSSGLNSLNLQLMNLGNVMNGTDDDIRSEVTASGGFATDSQVAAMATARNNTLIKQYNALAAQHTVAQDYVTNTMQYETQDQAERDNQQNIALTKVTDATGILDKMASLQTTMISSAQDQYNKIVTNVGYKGLSQIVAGNPYQQSLAETALGLPQGTLSDPDKVDALQTYKEQQLAQGQQKIVLQYGDPTQPNGTGTTTPSSGNGSAANNVQQTLGIPDMSISLSAAVAQYGAPAIAQAMIANEGGSPQGVNNNPGNIKYYKGLPGATDSGVKATDGGTFASFSSADAGKSAIANIITNAANGKSGAYGSNPTIGSFVGTYTNTGTNDSSKGSGSILSATGLSIQAFNYLTQGNSSLTRLSAPQRKIIQNEAEQFLNNNGIDLSTFQSRYTAYNQVLTGNVMRTNAAQIQEKELQGTIANLDTTIKASDLKKLKTANVAKILAGQEVNDPLTTQYKTYLLSLQNELAGYNAAARGNLSSSGGPSPDQSDNEEAAKVITEGIGSGSLQGFKDAITAQQEKMGVILTSSVDNANKQVWDLFGVGDQYKPTNTSQGTSSAQQLVEKSLDAIGLKYDQAIAHAPSGQIGVVENSTGTFGYIPAEEFDASQYTRI